MSILRTFHSLIHGCLLLSITACDPGAYIKNFLSRSNTGSSSSNSAHANEDTVGNSARGNVTKDLQDSFNRISSADKKSSSRKVRATIYFIPDEKNYPGAKTSTVRDTKGNIIANVSSSFKSALALQGSGILEDGRTVNVSDGKGHYFVTPHKYGVGSSPDHPLVPFRSLAVDLSYWRNAGYKISNGDKVYIKATDGMKIPGTNKIHNGVWEISDRGAGIKGNRIDMFFGTMHWRTAMKYLADKNNFSKDFTEHNQASNIGSSSYSIDMSFLI
ncbi:MAG: 3D domain-containing protein [Bdellovibrionota bacterium]